ncbi:pterin-4-alpha-carbinolamine dehydratase [Candidatus Cerribacteria bacterium 'Amazon FNV 2010 28 9']|uniref:Putative pterin-4-alpha-carbinolamine dehydratase n=1 Tax=Candidatus Cerribacteria bacterium 'Amazon FNV 2010 28 9' TaxID=2081795 RepID=A0A317JR58_9BACT|nr:MAG: pterin-4-alpha-carbinolamine dehydratase [Candidatus Cerribacteria bacterium 'Amazon FNV 2010 28 9']
MDSHLSKGHCVPCEGGTKPMTREEFAVYLPQLPAWTVENNDNQLKREFTFNNFTEALAFVNKVGAIAESEGHHPNIFMHDWKYVTITLTTFAIGGLSINDFVLAAKIDELLP